MLRRRGEEECAGTNRGGGVCWDEMRNGREGLAWWSPTCGWEDGWVGRHGHGGWSTVLQRVLLVCELGCGNVCVCAGRPGVEEGRLGVLGKEKGMSERRCGYGCT